MRAIPYLAALVAVATVLAGCSDSGGSEPAMPVIEDADSFDLSQLTPQVITADYPFSLSNQVGRGKGMVSIAGQGAAGVNIKVYPFYAFEGSGSSGDYYIVDAELTIDQEGMDNGTKSGYVKIGSDGRPEEGYTVEGYFLRQLEFACSLLDDKGNEVARFPAGYSPVPESTVGSTTYTYGLDFSLEGILKVAFNVTTGEIYAEARVVPGAHFTNTYTVNLPDIVIANNSTNSAVGYRDYLPFKLDMTHVDIPEAARTKQTFHKMWLWYVPTTKDSDGDEVKFSLSYSCRLRYGDFYYMDHMQTNGYQETPHDIDLGTATVAITPPSRVPMGYIQINNSSADAYLSGFAVTPKDGTKPLITTEVTDGVAPGDCFKCMVDVGKYDVKFMHGTDPTAMTRYIYSSDFIVVEKDKTVALDSEYDFWEDTSN